MSYYRNVLLPKCPVTEMSCYRNVSYQNVHYQSVLYRNVWIPFQTDCSGSPHPSRMRPRPPVISPGNFLMNNCSENADVSLRHKMIIHIKKNSCLHTLRLPRPSSSYTPPHPSLDPARPSACLLASLLILYSSARLAQSVEHGTLTANQLGSKQSQGRGFEPHIGRSF